MLLVAILSTIVLVSVKICYTEIDVKQFQLDYFESDKSLSSMKAFLSFISTYQRSYTSNLEMA
jgi:Na+/pantothenate symporter